LLPCQLLSFTLHEYGSHGIFRAFSGPSTLIICTLLGKVTQYHVAQEEARRASPPEQEWSMNTKTVSKVNAMVVNERWIIIGGLCKEGKGVIEVWNRVTDVNVIE
jgi:hypothetical protein